MSPGILFLIAISISNTEPEIEHGRAVYMQRCKVCHGVKGETNPFAAQVLNPPPRNFISNQSKKELTEKRMIASATNGKAGTAMMPWKEVLSPEEILAVVRYIRKELMKL